MITLVEDARFCFDNFSFSTQVLSQFLFFWLHFMITILESDATFCHDDCCIEALKCFSFSLKSSVFVSPTGHFNHVFLS